MYKRAAKNGGSLLARVGIALVALLIAGTVLIVIFGGAVLNHFAKRKVGQAFAKAYPESALQIGQLEYTLSDNRLVAQSVTLSATNSTIKADRISLLGVRWATLIWGTAELADVLAKTSLDASNLDLEFPQAHYGIRCARLRSLAPESELIAERAELRPFIYDEAFFAAHDFRTTRFHVVVPECRVFGLEYVELFAAKSCRARSVQFFEPSFDALVNLDKPAGPFVKSPLMVHEALVAIREPLQIDSVSITNGSLRYCERVAAGAGPAVLTIGAVNLTARGIANHGESSAAILVRAQGNLMDVGMMDVLMSIPITPTDFSLRYSGSLSAMNLTNLDAFLDVDAHTRIKSGTVKDAAFEIDVTAGKALGHVRANYQNLEIALLDKQTGAETGFDHRVASFLTNALKIRSSNAPDTSGASKVGEVAYTRKPDEEFQQFLWLALRTGVLDIISH